MQGSTKFPPFPHQQFLIAHFLWKKWEEIKFEGEEIKNEGTLIHPWVYLDKI